MSPVGSDCTWSGIWDPGWKDGKGLHVSIICHLTLPVWCLALECTFRGAGCEEEEDVR